ncbi:MAG: hypothetical protein ACRCUJ_09090 [Phocaeicola sp.]
MKNNTNVFLLSLVVLLGFFSCSENNQRQKVSNLMPSEVIEELPNCLQSINLFMENSGSMNGYVKGVTELEETVYSLLSKIESSECSDTLQLFYVNSRLIPLKWSVREFVNNLEPLAFKNAGGALGSSDIADLLQLVLAETNDSTLSIFISDCIFSPGKNVDARSYLGHQEIAINSAFVNACKTNSELGVIIYHLSSNFTGTYYDKVDRKVELSNQKRPYYIWLIGNVEHLKKITTTLNKDPYRGGGVLNELVLLPHYSTNKIQFDILNSPTIGEFRKSPKNKLMIQKSSVASKGPRKGDFMFTVGVNFSPLILPDEYLLDSLNYKISNPNFSVKVLKSTNPRYTHFLQIYQKPSMRFVEKGTLSVSLKNSIPAWVQDVNDDIGEKLEQNKALEKTFGLNYLVDGLYGAYNHDSFFDFEITIK